MSKAAILKELSKLNPGELHEIHDRILQLEEEELLTGRTKPSEAEKQLLDGELADYAQNPNAGSDWEEVEARLKQ